jgi:hypothetical protein
LFYLFLGIVHIFCFIGTIPGALLLPRYAKESVFLLSASVFSPCRVVSVCLEYVFVVLCFLTTRVVSMGFCHRRLDQMAGFTCDARNLADSQASGQTNSRLYQSLYAVHAA